jgi:phosphoribosylformylglycinamidine synthase PurS subunit
MTTAAAAARATMAVVQLSVLVEVRLRPGIADPQGATIERSLPTLGFGTVRDVTVGKAIRCTVEAEDADAARRQVEELCRRFLTNPVIEDATITIEPAPATVG